MQKKTPWYVSERLHALCVILLTERDDLVVIEPDRESDLDVVVEMRDGGILKGRRFGVMLKTIPTNGRPQSALPRRVPNFDFPVCFFMMRVDQGVEPTGWYGWEVEPRLSEDGRPVLENKSSGIVGTLDRQALDEIVAKVNAWYDALHVSV